MSMFIFSWLTLVNNELNFVLSFCIFSECDTGLTTFNLRKL